MTLSRNRWSHPMIRDLIWRLKEIEALVQDILDVVRFSQQPILLPGAIVVGCDQILCGRMAFPVAEPITACRMFPPGDNFLHNGEK